MSSVNKVILIGNLGGDPELKTTQAGKSVVNFGLATSFGFGEKAVTEWHRIVLWEKNADSAAQYLKKGSKVYIEGRLQTRSYEDKNGEKRYTTEVVGEKMTFLTPKGESGGHPDPGARAGSGFDGEDDMPF